MGGEDGAFIQPPGLIPELAAGFPQHALDGLPASGRQIPDGAHAQPFELCRGSLAHEEQRAHRERIEDLPKVLPGEHGGGIRLAVIAAQLGERAVERHAHRDRQPYLHAHAAAQLVRDLLPRAEQMCRSGYIQKGFINTERVNQIGIL